MPRIGEMPPFELTWREQLELESTGQLSQREGEVLSDDELLAAYLQAQRNGKSEAQGLRVQVLERFSKEDLLDRLWWR